MQGLLLRGGGLLYGVEFICYILSQSNKVFRITIQKHFSDVDFSAQNKLGATPLHLASELEDVRIAGLIVKYIPKPCYPEILLCTNKKQETALHLSVRLKSSATTKILLDNLAIDESNRSVYDEYCDYADKHGNTPLHYAVINKSEENVQLLITW